MTEATTTLTRAETMITLLTKYAAHVKIEAFRVQSERFRDHAIRYRDRWQSLLEVFASKGEFPTAAPVFPVDFPKAVQSEISARKLNP